MKKKVVPFIVGMVIGSLITASIFLILGPKQEPQQQPTQPNQYQQPQQPQRP